MDLVSFLEWEDSNGIYRSEIDGKDYRVVDNKLEIYNPDLLEWEDCDMPINEHYKLKSVEQVYMWSEGFEIHDEEEWELVKTHYLQMGYDVSEDVMFIAETYIENNIVFYTWVFGGKLGFTVHRYTVQRILVLKPIDWKPKYYAKYAGKINFGEEMYWQIDSNHCTASLVERDNVENWHSIGMLSTLRDWKRRNVTKENAIFIPVGSDKI